MKTIYELGDRVEFIARNECNINGSIIIGKWSHHVGYIKQIRHSLLGVRYVVNIAKSSEVYFVPRRDIIGRVEARDYGKHNNSNK